MYCDMEGSDWDGEEGWTRVAVASMSGSFCPPGQTELIGASPMWIAHKTAKLFTCLGGSSQLGQSIIQYDNIINTSLYWINNGIYCYKDCKSTFFSNYGSYYTKLYM